MKTQMNGINYTDEVLTDEELAVIKLMREGGQVDVIFSHSSYEEAMNHAEIIPQNVFYDISFEDFSRTQYPFVNFEIRSDDENVRISHYITI